jgi:hypothetical protein
MLSPSIRTGSPARAVGYPYLREALDDRFASLPPEDIERLIDELFGPGVEAEDVEDILGSIGRAFGSIGPAIGNFASQAAPVLGRALPGVASGAAAGSVFGPLGTFGGAVLGGLGSLLGGGGAPPAAAPRPSAAPAPGPAPPVPAGTPAAAQLLAVLSRPETLQALMSMLMGPAGQRSVPVGPNATPVGLGGFSNLLGVLGNQASAEYRLIAPDADEGVPGYLMERADLDPAVPEHQAEALFALFREADRAEALTARRLARQRPFELDEAEVADDADLEAAITWGALLGAQDVDEWDESDD